MRKIEVRTMPSWRMAEVFLDGESVLVGNYEDFYPNVGNIRLPEKGDGWIGPEGLVGEIMRQNPYDEFVVTKLKGTWHYDHSWSDLAV